MPGWYLSEQARHALRTARVLAEERGNPMPGSANLLLAAILGQWEDEHAGGPALLRACGLTAEQASMITTKLLSADRDPNSPTQEREPRLVGSLRFVVDQAYRVAAETRAPYVGTEHLIAAMLWQDDATELRHQGVSYAQAAEQLATLPYHPERAEEIDPLEAVEVPTPAVASLAELARQQARRQPIEGGERISTPHYLLALAMFDTAASRLLGELGVTYQAIVERLAEADAQLVEADDGRPEEMPLDGWEKFDVTHEEREVIGRQVVKVLAGALWAQGVRYGGSDSWVMIHPGRSGLEPREILDRLLSRAS
jgi:hypothetical protein